jgi:hypothetical protein
MGRLLQTLKVGSADAREKIAGGIKQAGDSLAGGVQGLAGNLASRFS